MACRVVRLLARQQESWTVGQLKASLGEAGLNPDKAFRWLIEAKEPVITVSAPLTRSENERWCWPGPGARTVSAGPKFTDAFVVIDQRLAAQGQEKVWYASTLFQLNGDFYESEVPYRLNPVSGSGPLGALMAALDNDTVVTPDDLEDCQGILRAALFPDGTGAAEAVTKLLAARKGVRVRLHAGGDLARLPWEAAAHPDQSRGCLMLEDERLSLVRHTAAGKPFAAGGGALTTAVNYACLDSRLEHADVIESALTEAGWPAPRCWDPAEFLASSEPPGTRGGIVHLVAHAERRPALHRSGPGACELRVAGPGGAANVRARDLVAAVLAHEPALAVLAICWSGFQGGLTASIARELAAGGVPSVVAIRGQVELASLREFFLAFYATIGEGYPVELALHNARMAVTGQRLQRLQFVLVQRGETGTLAC